MHDKKLFSFFGNRSEHRAAIAITPPMNPREILIGNFPPYQSFSQTIFKPTKIRTTASPYFSKWNLSIAPASMKYMERSPRIAKIFEVNTRNGSFVKAKIAGTESTAKTISVNSKKISVTNKGVAAYRSSRKIYLRVVVAPLE